MEASHWPLPCFPLLGLKTKRERHGGWASQGARGRDLRVLSSAEKLSSPGAPLGVQEWRLHTPRAGGPSLIPSQGARSLMLHLRPSATKESSIFFKKETKLPKSSPATDCPIFLSRISLPPPQNLSGTPYCYPDKAAGSAGVIDPQRPGPPTPTLPLAMLVGLPGPPLSSRSCEGCPLLLAICAHRLPLHPAPSLCRPPPQGPIAGTHIPSWALAGPQLPPLALDTEVPV